MRAAIGTVRHTGPGLPTAANEGSPTDSMLEANRSTPHTHDAKLQRRVVAELATLHFHSPTSVVSRHGALPGLVGVVGLAFVIAYAS